MSEDFLDKMFGPPPKPPKRRKTPRRDLEGSVVKECLEFLHHRCPDVAYVERRNTGAVAFEGGGFLRFGSKGAADIWCLIRGESGLIHIELEIKRRDKRGRLSEDQKQFQRMCKDEGIPYFVITSVEELIASLGGLRC
jgi:hypothetical protein